MQSLLLHIGIKKGAPSNVPTYVIFGVERTICAPSRDPFESNGDFVQALEAKYGKPASRETYAQMAKEARGKFNTLLSQVEAKLRMILV